MMKYKAKLIDQITEREMSRQIFEQVAGQERILIFDCDHGDNRAHFILDSGGVIHTSAIQNTAVKDGQVVIVTKNSTYVFEIISEISPVTEGVV